MSIDVEIVLCMQNKRDISFTCISITFLRCRTGKASEWYMDSNRNSHSWKWVEQCFLAQDPQGLQSCVEFDLPLQATWHL